MQFQELDIKKSKSKKRVGRGISAGQGKTAGRGTKGQSARSGGKRRPGFEGGQTPIMMRLPKLRGFKSKRKPTENVYTYQLSGTVDNFSLYDGGLISSPYVNVKVITKGKVSSKVTVMLQGASASAVEAINNAGGEFKKVAKPARQAKK